MRKRVFDDETRERVIRALACGRFTLGDVAKKAGISPQLARQWALMAHVNWKLARQNVVDKGWRIITGQEQAERRDKRKMREAAEQAKREWDAKVNEQEAPTATSGS